jgi:hypothetical protein
VDAKGQDQFARAVGIGKNEGDLVITKVALEKSVESEQGSFAGAVGDVDSVGI